MRKGFLSRPDTASEVLQVPFIAVSSKTAARLVAVKAAKGYWKIWGSVYLLVNDLEALTVIACPRLAAVLGLQKFGSYVNVLNYR